MCKRIGSNASYSVGQVGDAYAAHDHNPPIAEMNGNVLHRPSPIPVNLQGSVAVDKGKLS